MMPSPPLPGALSGRAVPTVWGPAPPHRREHRRPRHVRPQALRQDQPWEGEPQVNCSFFFFSSSCGRRGGLAKMSVIVLNFPFLSNAAGDVLPLHERPGSRQFGPSGDHYGHGGWVWWASCPSLASYANMSDAGTLRNPAVLFPCRLWDPWRRSREADDPRGDCTVYCRQERRSWIMFHSSLLRWVSLSLSHFPFPCPSSNYSVCDSFTEVAPLRPPPPPSYQTGNTHEAEQPQLPSSSSCPLQRLLLPVSRV